MCDFIEEVGVIDDSLQRKIIEYVKNHNGVFTSSQLYSSALDKKFIDDTKRKSIFKVITGGKWSTAGQNRRRS